jgi:huntingtin
LINNIFLPFFQSLFDRLFSRHGLDLTSSLQILIELYVRWLTTNPNNLCLQLKYELIRSFIYLSDLFTSSQQLTSLYDLCDEYFRTWFDEDDLIMSLISYGLCKSGILLGHTSKESNEFYQRLIERNLKYLTKTNAYASCLFILESHEDDLNKSLITILIQELNNEIQNNNFKTNLDIRLNGFILANLFYLIENNHTNSYEILSLLFKDDVLDSNDNLTQQIISIGLERLLLLSQYPKNDIWRLYKRSITTLRQSTWLNIDHLVLILARIYTLLPTTSENSNTSNNENANEEQEMIDGTSIISSSDNIVIELVGELYERTKQSYTLPHEAILLLRPLPSLLGHIGLSDRLMNKVVVEFAASTQQLYPQILAYIVFAVFRALINAHYSAKVNEWTLLSMTSVAQRKPIRMAIWGLTCLMLSACPSHAVADAL